MYILNSCTCALIPQHALKRINFIQYKKRNISRTQGERWYRKKATTEEKKL
jgi:hypothetical protein